MAQTTNVSSLSTTTLPPTSDGKTFTAPTSDLRPQPNPTSSATISNTTALDADGSLQLSGDRTRVYNNLSGLNIAASSLEALTGDYIVNNGGNGGIQSPAFRVYVLDANGRQNELIWESAYNGGYTLGQKDSVQSGDMFWRQIVNQGFDGTGGIGTGSYIMKTLADWGDFLGGTTLGIGVGNGSGAGADFNAIADNLSLSTSDRRAALGYNFAAAAAVPEPGTWALMLLGFGGIGVAMRRQRRAPALLQVA
ncbi:PEPxxWA-CTERM sorting domain-containing protein [Sphingomonas humi]|uniref:PEPxxWA-CTERM sorting domain-containing protein n=1 Tax=Sphingomonas humi TaxID=335630 RepID=UPI0031D90B34